MKISPTYMRAKMCAYARKCEVVKRVITSNGRIICFLKREGDQEGKLVVIDQPEDLTKVSREPKEAILKRFDLARHSRSIVEYLVSRSKSFLLA